MFDRKIQSKFQPFKLTISDKVEDFVIDRMKPEQWKQVATLIHDSTNAWYQTNRGMDIFSGGADSTMLFCDAYEGLDPGCCLIAESSESNRIVGSCFYHPRETHFSLGIMNVHPTAFGKGVAGKLLRSVIELARKQNLPVRLVSSAMNLDSFSLYTKAGFVPRQTYQDMILDIPENGICDEHVDTSKIRDAELKDVTSMGNLEFRIAGISREKDYRYFIENSSHIWHTSVPSVYCFER